MAAVKIKLCGMTRPEDAAAAAELGADFVGMVLHAPSRRRIDLKRAQEIVGVLPESTIPVGMFVDASTGEIRDAVSALGLRYVQLHGNESPRMVVELEGLSVFKAVPVDGGTLLEELRAWQGARNVVAMLLDSTSGGKMGGTGVENDWDAIERAQQAIPGLPPLIVAGGLAADNVAGVVRRLRPWAVDVSSGIESSPGIKSREKMAAFVKAVREA